MDTNPINTTLRTRIKAKDQGCSWKGNATFIPYKLKIMVGIDRTIVMDVSVFITIFKLLEITEAKASMVPLKILL